MTNKAKAARFSVLSNTTLVTIKLIAGVMSGSVAILSEAVHSAIDLAAAGMAYFSVRAADIPADQEHPFGHGKIENVSGAVEATLIFAAAAYIVYESIRKLIIGGEVESLGLGILVMAVSAAVNIAVSRWLFHVARLEDSVALEADAHHLSVDVYTSLGVLVGLALIQLTGLQALDPIIGIAVAAVITRVAYQLVRKAGGPLIDTGLPAQEISKLNHILCSDPRVLAYHKLRTRKSGAQRHIDVHLLVPQDLSVSEGHTLAEEVEDRIRAEFSPVDVITHVEPMSDEEVRDSTIFCPTRTTDKEEEE